MDDLLKAALIFQNLKDTEYRFILGRKNKLTEIRLIFQEDEFFHLLGIHKLKDLADVNQLRKSFLQNIITGKITLEHLQRSRYYKYNPDKRILGIEDRIQSFSHFQQLLDCNKLVFRYNPKVFPYSKIDANYLLEYTIEKPLYLFLDKHNDDFYFSKSFFPLSVRSYSHNQIRLTLLHKEKYNRLTNEITILYSRLKEVPSLYEGQNKL